MRKKTNNLIFPLLLMGVFLIFASSCKKDDYDNGNGNTTQEGSSGSTFTDPRDGKVYQTVVIGNQVWMAENLAYEPSSGNYWAYDNNNSNVETYGYLYDWESACDVCPDGWHLPTNAEWTELTDYLGGTSVAGGKLKETGTTHWKSPNTGATNETGFTALPGGGRGLNGTFDNFGFRGGWWSATEYDAANAWYRLILNNFSNVLRNYYPKEEVGYSVRCVRD